MKLTGNTILVTGGSSGIGLALAKELVRRNNKVIVTSRRKEVVAAIISENKNLVGYQVDVSNIDSVRNLKNQVESLYPDLNIIINSAGIMQPINFFDDSSAVTTEIETNLLGTININKVLLPLIKDKKESAIVNISSALSYVASPAHPIYSASKAGINALTDAIRGQAKYFGYKNLHVILVAPPLISETNLQPEFKDPKIKKPFPFDMDLNRFVKIVLKGMEKNKEIINPGAAKLLCLVNKLMTKNMKIRVMRNSMANYFK